MRFASSITSDRSKRSYRMPAFMLIPQHLQVFTSQTILHHITHGPLNLICIMTIQLSCSRYADLPRWWPIRGEDHIWLFLCPSHIWPLSYVWEGACSRDNGCLLNSEGVVGLFCLVLQRKPCHCVARDTWKMWGIATCSSHLLLSPWEQGQTHIERISI